MYAYKISKYKIYYKITHRKGVKFPVKQHKSFVIGEKLVVTAAAQYVVKKFYLKQQRLANSKLKHVSG